MPICTSRVVQLEPHASQSILMLHSTASPFGHFQRWRVPQFAHSQATVSFALMSLSKLMPN
jgi:hypothetical protein